jgi:hypothetical protein
VSACRNSAAGTSCEHPREAFRLIQILPIIVAGLLLVSALLAASETALFALTRMEHTREQFWSA